MKRINESLTPELSITVVHALPHRLRCRLSHLPKEWDTANRAIRNHEGIESLELNTASRSILVMHDPRLISREEFIIRLAVVLSSDYDGASVRLLTVPEREEMTTFSFLAGLMLAGAAVARFVPGLSSMRTASVTASSVATAAAVVGHGYRELLDTGSFDPEVLSVIYLIYSLIQGRGLTASVITWIASFGRHLITPPFESLRLQVQRAPGTDEGDPSFTVSIRPDRAQPRLYSFFRFAQTAIAEALSGGSLGRDQLISRIRDVTAEHDQILEGIGARQDRTISIQMI